MLARIARTLLAVWAVQAGAATVDGAALPSFSGWQSGAGYRQTPLIPSKPGRVGFAKLPPDVTGVWFTNRVSDEALASNQILEVGSGVALGDIDGDGRVDIYLCAMEGGNRLFRNHGNWRFEDVTARANIGCEGQHSTGAVFADVDGDGDLDLLVASIGGGTRLFLNRGDGVFAQSADSGLSTNGGSTTISLADINGDGWLDIYVANYHTRTIKDSSTSIDLRAGWVNGKFEISPAGIYAPIFLRSGGVSLLELGQPDVLYLNTGNGKFVAQSWTNGMFLAESGAAVSEAPRDWGLTAMMRDLDGDGLPDIYVCNDFFGSPDRIWINQGGGRFRALRSQAIRHTSMSSMSVDVTDINQDGYDDILVVDMMSRDHRRRHRQRGSLVHVQADVLTGEPMSRPEYPRNTLQLSRGDGTFAEIAQYSGLEASEWTWSCVFLDVDLDGFSDVLMTTGNLRDANDADLTAASTGNTAVSDSMKKAKRRFPRLESPMLAFRNLHDLRFEECGQSWGFDFTGVSHGMALADLDNDGDLDVVVNSMGHPAGIYRNEISAPRVAVRLRGRRPNSEGIGARITVEGGAVPTQSQEVVSGGRYLSGDDSLRVFAAGSDTNRLKIDIRWRSGARSVVPEALAGQLYEVWENLDELGTTVGQGPPTAKSPSHNDLLRANPASMVQMFEDISVKLKHPHQSIPFNDYQRQPLLPEKLSTLGPGIGWYDLDGDGWEDLLVAGGRGSPQLVYLNDGQGGFRPVRRRDAVVRDQTGILARRNGAGRVELLVGSSNYQDTSGSSPSVLRFDLEKESTPEGLGEAPASTGPLALGILGEKQVMFVGGRVLPGRYPEAASSQLFVDTPGGWQLDAANTAKLDGVGLVSGATWTDLDGDGALELVLACEWGSLKVFAPTAGILKDVTHHYGLDEHVGLWTSVASGDFDGDGRLDLVAGNRGLNTRYERHRAKPIRLYYGDLADDGGVETFETYYDEPSSHYAPFQTLDLLRQTLPGIATRFPTFEAYARASIEEILGDSLPRVRYLEAKCFESSVFLNRGGRFERHALPPEAQFARVFGLSVGDGDGDGKEDLFLAQNFFDVEPESSRQDAGRGLWLQGDGQGGFVALSGQKTGVILYGQQRGSALCDFDRDGRVDLAVAQYRGPFGLFRNVTGKPGIRVRLRGPNGNRDGVGAVLRLRYDAQFGPSRIVQAGSGYWSQESLVQIMGLGGVPLELQVRWPSGRLSRHPIEGRTREIVVDADQQSPTINRDGAPTSRE